MGIDRRDFLQRLTSGLVALILTGRGETIEPAEPLEYTVNKQPRKESLLDFACRMGEPRPKRYARVSHHWSDGKPLEAWLETSPSPDGPFVRSHRIPMDQSLHLIKRER